MSLSLSKKREGTRVANSFSSIELSVSRVLIKPFTGRRETGNGHSTWLVQPWIGFYEDLSVSGNESSKTENSASRGKSEIPTRLERRSWRGVDDSFAGCWTKRRETLKHPFAGWRVGSMAENLDRVGLNVNRTGTAQEGCVGCRFKLEPVSVEMGSIHTQTHTHTHAHVEGMGLSILHC